MTSIVIPLGTGSRWDNTELRYCLRSVEKHLIGYGDVFIVGEKPDWLRNVIHIPFNEGFAPKAYEKERNIFNKIMAACADERVTDDFLFANDDHFLLQDLEAGKFPFFYDRFLHNKMTVTDYKYTVLNTAEALKGQSPPYTDVHCPIIYNKSAFKALSRLDWEAEWGYCIKTIYCSKYVSINSMIEINDLKIEEAHRSTQIYHKLQGRPWFSIGDRAREGDMLRVLQELYPKKSIYE